MEPKVQVELLTRVNHRGGGLLHKGEVAAFDQSTALDLVRRGAARLVLAHPELQEGDVSDDSKKAPSAPPANKMVGTPGKETPRRK